MFFRTLLILTFMLLSVNGDSSKLTPTLTTSLLEIQNNAQTCSAPIEADEKLTEEFKYGCFCGEKYPKLDTNRTDDFRKLTKEERRKEIVKLYSIKPFDEIDEICQQHDICYLYHGKKAKICNDAIYENLYTLADEFKEDKNQTLVKEQCYNLATDIASVFKTLFAMADDEDTIFDMGMAIFNTGITVGNKAMQESIDTIVEHEARYPKKGQRCSKN